jgi:hypothetical protein
MEKETFDGLIRHLDLLIATICGQQSLGLLHVLSGRLHSDLVGSESVEASQTTRGRSSDASQLVANTLLSNSLR